MKAFRTTLSILLVLLGTSVSVWAGGDDKIKPATEVKDFALINVTGKVLDTRDFKAAKYMVVVFSCNHCPFAKLYPERLKELHTQLAGQKVPMVVVSSSDTLVHEEDGYAQMQSTAASGAYNFPYLMDRDQKVARMFGASKTPQAYVLVRDGALWKVAYQGAIDDNGEEPAAVKQTYVKDAISALLAGKKLTVTSTPAIGCRINYRKA